MTILKSLVSKHNIERIYSHYETWNKFTGNRDKIIQEWVTENSVDWIEYQQISSKKFKMSRWLVNPLA